MSALRAKGTENDRIAIKNPMNIRGQSAIMHSHLVAIRFHKDEVNKVENLRVKVSRISSSADIVLFHSQKYF